MHVASPHRPVNRVHRVLAALEPLPAASAGRALFLLSGLPGSGKSTFARRLSSLTGAVVLESDRFRRLLFAEPVFSARESQGLFSAIQGATRLLLGRDLAVIIDATNVSESDRAPFLRLADRSAAPLTIVALDAPPRVIAERLQDRLNRPNGYSFADLDVYHRMRPRVEPISREHLTVDTSDPAATETALRAIANEYLLSPQALGIGGNLRQGGTVH